MFACHLILCVRVVKTMMTFFANWKVCIRFDPKLCTYSTENMHGGLFDGGAIDFFLYSPYEFRGFLEGLSVK